MTVLIKTILLKTLKAMLLKLLTEKFLSETIVTLLESLAKKSSNSIDDKVVAAVKAAVKA